MLWKSWCDGGPFFKVAKKRWYEPCVMHIYTSQPCHCLCRVRSIFYMYDLKQVWLLASYHMLYISGTHTWFSWNQNSMFPRRPGHEFHHLSSMCLFCISPTKYFKMNLRQAWTVHITPEVTKPFEPLSVCMRWDRGEIQPGSVHPEFIMSCLCLSFHCDDAAFMMLWASMLAPQKPN